APDRSAFAGPLGRWRVLAVAERDDLLVATWVGLEGAGLQGRFAAGLGPLDRVFELAQQFVHLLGPGLGVGVALDRALQLAQVMDVAQRVGWAPVFAVGGPAVVDGDAPVVAEHAEVIDSVHA